MISLDTNAVIALMIARPPTHRVHLARTVAQGDALVLSAIVVFELQFGVAKSDRKIENAARLADFLAGDIQILPFTEEDAAAAGEIRADLERKGTPIGAYDLLIGAQALRHKATLVTGNLREFRRIKGLKCVDWARP